MVVLVPGDHVEHGTTHLFFHFAHAETEKPDGFDSLFVRIGARDVVVEMPQRAE